MSAIAESNVTPVAPVPLAAHQLHEGDVFTVLGGQRWVVIVPARRSHYGQGTTRRVWSGHLDDAGARIISRTGFNLRPGETLLVVGKYTGHIS